MLDLYFNDACMRLDADNGYITSVNLGGTELLAEKSYLFCFRIRHRDHSKAEYVSAQATDCTVEGKGRDHWEIMYSGFPGTGKDIYVSLIFAVVNKQLTCEVHIKNNSADMIEWIEVLPIVAEHLRGDGGNCEGEILFPYNEGAIVDTLMMRNASKGLKYEEPEYPSIGSYGIFPNMICSQMMAYLFTDGEAQKRALYLGAHDEKRGVKQIDFCESASQKGVKLLFKYFCGVEYGADYHSEFPLVLESVRGTWEDAAEIYRTWFSKNLPPRLKKISDNCALPDWYEDSPLIISYPIRGIHDKDKMTPNQLYPYTNALPMIDEIGEATNARIMVILMHWEGTAPWAPPYVWPPYGDYNDFNSFLEELHKRGYMLGVYCSGFGYTLKSNLVDDYDCTEIYTKNDLKGAMCADPDDNVHISRICTGQRSGYDICPASGLGKSILADAYAPLLNSNIDYAQILDQNHGGGQYFCYSSEHGHPPAPGTWMTENMQEMLSQWNDMAGMTLLGCESAASEPFMGNLLFSDNRFELCYQIGRPIPLYAYIYHEYVRNFMGNQVSCPLPKEVDTLRYRIAYSFSVGDCMTIVLTPDGRIMPNWGTKVFDCCPDKDKVLTLIKNLNKFYQSVAKPYLFNGRMIKGMTVCCNEASFGHNLPEILTSAWDAEGKRGQIFVNPFDEDKTCTVGEKIVCVPANNAIFIELENLLTANIHAEKEIL